MGSRFQGLLSGLEEYFRKVYGGSMKLQASRVRQREPEQPADQAAEPVDVVGDIGQVFLDFGCRIASLDEAIHLDLHSSQGRAQLVCRIPGEPGGLLQAYDQA